MTLKFQAGQSAQEYLYQDRSTDLACLQRIAESKFTTSLQLNIDSTFCPIISAGRSLISIIIVAATNAPLLEGI
jgi:hypothetical protein